ncbi:rho-type guanine nucleotide exchange factor isoform X1 [Haematobia irritans]|uniref:rho-type guanine nucleotide exchange factor isoform X1 n=1 Tax=Haematobia irritans TaxID=7368 RepID=UPI003F50BAD5
MEQPLIVQAEYSFKGGNNDELCFKKGDLITVTQREEGGWWEGTLNEKTGWFPSNYVMEYKAPLPITDSIRPPEEIQEYRSVVLKDLLDSERAHVAEVQGLLENFLEPLQQTQILNADEYAQLMCNFVEVVKTHEELLTQMEECNDRVGKLFLNKAPLMKQVHQAYCAAHPKAIVILDKYKDELEKYMERQGAATPGLLVLTTGLSKPFRRLDKYSAMLQELERHMESSHPDRGDTQRSVAVYKDIAATCSATRRQKELELQVLTGPVRGWQGQELSSLGEIIHMGSVAVGLDHRDRYFVLFPQTLLILSVSQRMSAFIYEGKLPLTGIIVNRLEDSDTYKNAFEISSPLIERIVAICQGPNEANKWVELLTSTNTSSIPIGIKRQHSNLSSASISGGHISTPPTHSSYNLDARGYCTRFSLCAYYNSPQMSITLPPSNYPPTAPYARLSDHFAKLVKAGLLKNFLVKMLLYPQSRQSVDMGSVPLRRKKCHKTSQKLVRSQFMDGESDASSEKAGLERQDAFSLPTDSESDSVGDGSGIESSKDFDFIQFSRNDSIISTGTFIDHGSGAATPKKTRHCSSINLINLDSTSEDGCSCGSPPSNNGLKKESLVIGSKTMRAIARKSTEQSIIIHTSKAHLDLSGGGCGNGSNVITICDVVDHSIGSPPGLQQQISEASGRSSVYGGRLKGAYIACENLADLCDEAKIKASTSQLAISPTERHSMPNMFVGNRFNRSSKTAVYVPSWQDRNDKLNQSADGVENSQDLVDGEIHASTLDLPAMCREAPDKLQAELLYNFNDNLDNVEVNDLIAPPSMYKNFQDDAKNFNNFTLSQTELCFEPKRVSGPSDDTKEKRNSIKRCISYHYVPLANEGDEAHSSSSMQLPPDRNANRRHFSSEGTKDGSTSTKCKCCESSQCPSPRSSDSGMAGSCTINSPDPPQSDGAAYEPYYDVDGNLKLLANENNASSSDLARFDVCGTFREKFLETIQQQPSLDSPLATPTAAPEPSVTSLEFQRNSKSIFISSTAPSHAHNTSTSNFIFSTQANDATTPSSTTTTATEASGGEANVFRSGMYAHWWKKETLPHELVKSIAKVYNKRLPPSNQVSLDSRCSMCSNCFCSLEGRSGYSEGATYCSMCQDCISTCSSSNQQLATNTTTTITSAECPLCCNLPHSRNSEMMYTATTRTVAATPSHSSLSSPASSFDVDCPICSGNYLARVESLSSGKDEELSDTQTRELRESKKKTSMKTPTTSTSTTGMLSPSMTTMRPSAEDVTALKSKYADTTNKSTAATTSGQRGTINNRGRSTNNNECNESGGEQQCVPNIVPGSSNSTDVTTQTEPIVQSSPQLQSIHAHSASTTSSNASSTTTTKSTKSSSGSAKPQIKFSPDIEQYFEDANPGTSHSKHHGGKRKDRKHKS